MIGPMHEPRMHSARPIIIQLKVVRNVPTQREDAHAFVQLQRRTRVRTVQQDERKRHCPTHSNRISPISNLRSEIEFSNNSDFRSSTRAISTCRDRIDSERADQ
jgi:hypothetical protein